MSEWVSVGRTQSLSDQLSQSHIGNQPGHSHAKLPCKISPRYTPNPDFFGRSSELKELDVHLLPQKDEKELPCRHYAICGLGGVGKTDLAVEWFYRKMREEVFQAMFWIDAAQTSQLAANYSKTASELHILAPEKAVDLVASRETAKEWFARASVPWLVVFDNADGIDILGDYWPTGENGSILVTSRDPLAKSFRSFSMPGIDLGPLPEAEAAQLIRNLTACDNSEAEREASTKMATQLGSLPLAILQMSGIIRRRQWSVQEFVEKYAQDTRYRSLRKVGNNPQLSRYGSTLATAWNFTDLDANALQLLMCLSMLNPDRVQEYLFTDSKLQMDGSHEGLFDDEDEFDNAKQALLSSSVISRNKITRELSIHRVVGQEARACTGDLFRNFCLAIHLVCGAWPFNDALEKRHATSRWGKCEEIFPHLEHLHKLYATYRAEWRTREPTMETIRLFQEGAA